MQNFKNKLFWPVSKSTKLISWHHNNVIMMVFAREVITYNWNIYLQYNQPKQILESHMAN